MPATFTIPLVTVIAGQTITASERNAEFENIDTNFIPSGMDDYSATDGEMQTTTDPYPGSATSRPTSLQGELERLRYVIAQLSGETYWYQDPDSNIASLYAKFPVQTADIGALQVTTAKIAASAVDETKIASSVAGDGLAGGAGTALSVNVDNSTLEVNADSVRIKDAGVTSAKLATSLVVSTLSATTLTGSSFNASSSMAFAGFNMLKILQIVTASTSTQSARSSSTFGNTNLTATITPKINTSKILVFASGTFRTDSSDIGYITLARGGTNLSGSSAGLASMGSNSQTCVSLIQYDSPATTSATTYSVQTRSNGAGSVKFPFTESVGTSEAQMILIEIAQ